MATYTGTLDGWFETGTEGMIWNMTKDGEYSQPYEDMCNLDEGDHLKVFSPDGKVLFDDIIQPDYEIGYTEYPLNPGYGQPSALGYWIHWTQAGWQPDDWVRLFFHDPPLRAELTRK